MAVMIIESEILELLLRKTFSWLELTLRDKISDGISRGLSFSKPSRCPLDKTSTIGNNTLAGVGSSIRAPPSSETAKQGKQVPAFHGITDFAEVYSFIGSSFDLAPKAIMKAQRNESHTFLKQ